MLGGKLSAVRPHCLRPLANDTPNFQQPSASVLAVNRIFDTDGTVSNSHYDIERIVINGVIRGVQVGPAASHLLLHGEASMKSDRIMVTIDHTIE